jgi:hypothetical protein
MLSVVNKPIILSVLMHSTEVTGSDKRASLLNWGSNEGLRTFYDPGPLMKIVRWLNEKKMINP